jgi:hypothetical protein
MRFHVHIAVVDPDTCEYSDIDATFTVTAKDDAEAQQRVFDLLPDLGFDVVEIEEA